MAALTIETVPGEYGGMVQKVVTGFSPEEMHELQSMEHREAEQKVIEMLDERNGNTGTCWACGYGIYGFRIGQIGCTFTIGTSCD